ncbi:MAG TPA: DUF1631 domain-containing protein [Rhodanobacteraceae bacterium]|nr:DUF1631 domain-containing protein [Rhodanobacteraceae bacterium]
MNPQTETGKIVNLSGRQPTDERGGELLRAVRGIATTRSQALISSLFENVDDALFDLAEKAESNAVQTQYFDGMREVRKKRQLVERMFIDYVGRSVIEFANAAPASTADGGEAPRNNGAELSLVDDRELEESLAVTSMIAKADNRYARLLYSVNQRLSVISGGRKVEDADNPIGPGAFARCFRMAMRELEVDVKVKLIVYKLFERYVLAGLDTLYDAVNIDLVRAGVLPQLRLRSTRQGDGATTPATTDTAAASADANRESDAGSESPDYDDPQHVALRNQLYATVNQLLAQRRHHNAPARPAGPPMPALDVTELLSAISLLQQQAPPLPADRAALASNDTLSLDELKDALHAQIRKLGINAKGNVSGADEDTIELVGMLFEFILEDRNLPTPMQAMLGRLQIPYLKAALLEKQLFAQSSHPARRLLDALADAAKGWSEDGDRDQRLYNEIKGVVDTLLHNFDDDTSVFERLLARFQLFIEGNRQRSTLAEQRTAEASRGREKLQSARRIAAREILTRSRQTQLPDLIQNILTRPWANYLVLTLLRQGEQSAEWRSALRFIDELIWSAQPLTNDDARQRLRDLLPGLEKRLRQGLAAVAFHDADVRRLMRALGQFYHRQMGGELPPETMSEQAQDPTPLIPETVEAIATPADAEPEPPPPPVSADESAELSSARALKVGSWVEFVDADSGQRDRAKLSWISPISGKYLFVNRRGLKVCDMSLVALAESIGTGRTVVLEEVPLFDRALDAIVERLRKDQPTAEEADKPASSAPAGPTAE